MDNQTLTTQAIQAGRPLSTFVPYMAIYNTHTTTAHTGYNWKDCPRHALESLTRDVINGKACSLSIGYNC